MQRIVDSRRSSRLVWAVILGWVLLPGLAFATGISQSFSSTDQVVPGTLVELGGQSGTVKSANTDGVEDLLGVVIKNDSAILGVNGAGGVQVALSGTANTLVSTLNGDIKAGDKITASPISGVGMKAILSTKVVGVAQADFKADDAGATKRDIKDKSGKTTSVSIGQIPVLISPAYYVAGLGDQKTIIPPFIQNLVNAIAGRKVSVVRIIIASIILLFSLSAIFIVLSGAVRSGIIAIGRNPLSQGAVYRSLLHVMLASIGVLLVTFGAVYLIISR